MGPQYLHHHFPQPISIYVPHETPPCFLQPIYSNMPKMVPSLPPVPDQGTNIQVFNEFMLYGSPIQTSPSLAQDSLSTSVPTIRSSKLRSSTTTTQSVPYISIVSIASAIQKLLRTLAFWECGALALFVAHIIFQDFYVVVHRSHVTVPVFLFYFPQLIAPLYITWVHIPPL